MELTIIPCDEKGTVRYDLLEQAVKPNTKGIVCTHGSNLTGNLVDIKRIGTFSREKGILFVVDASQTAGVFPIHMEEMGIDVLCFTCLLYTSLCFADRGRPFVCVLFSEGRCEMMPEEIVFCKGGGCTAKLGAGVLERVLSRLPKPEKKDEMCIRDSCRSWRMTLYPKARF